MTSVRRGRHRGDAGTATLETVLFVLLVVPVLLTVIVFAGATVRSNLTVQAAAAEAARTASITRNGAVAAGRAEVAARDTLARNDLNCAPLTVRLDVGGFARDVGQAATVSATVTCRVNVAPVDFLRILPATTLEATRVSPLDTYRERG